MKPEEYEKLQARLTDLQNKKERQPSSGSNWRDGWEDAILAVKSMLHSEFKTDPVKPGYWIDLTATAPGGDTKPFKCSVCGRRAGYGQHRKYKFCPTCGAKMDEVIEE